MDPTTTDPLRDDQPGADPLGLFLPAVGEWFRSELGVPTPAQRGAWPAIAAGDDTFVVAPTGTGKTLAAFLAAIDRVLREPAGDSPDRGVDVVYVSPLKALNVDVERNLARPLQGIAALDPSLPTVTTAVRSGDTSTTERRRIVTHPPHILITTPESLYLLLTSRRARAVLGGVRTVIVDEVHAIAGSKRGVHLALSLERLTAFVAATSGGRPQRIGLSATVAPVDAAARFVVGTDRPVTVVDTGMRRQLDVVVRGDAFARDDDAADAADAGAGDDAGVWGRVTTALRDEIAAHDSTIVFVNNRRSAETLVARLNDDGSDDGRDDGDGVGDDTVAVDAGETVDVPAPVRAHHGSVAPEVRAVLEAQLKAGELPALVATGTLELGIDMGAVDLVCQVGSPQSVARALQRIGRAGHVVGAVATGRVFPLHRSDLAEAAAVGRSMRAGAIEDTSVPRNCLDVLAQHVVAEVATGDRHVDDLYALVRASAPYAELPRRSFDSVLAMCSGDVADPDLRTGPPRIDWDRTTGVLSTRPGAAQVAVRSGGTIPDRGMYAVHLAGTDVRLGELDEEFVFESKPGDVFALGSSLWRVVEITRDRVLVTEAPGAVPRMPFWRGEGPGRTGSLGRATGALLRSVDDACAAGRPTVDVTAELVADCGCDEVAADALVAAVRRQRSVAAVPTDRRIVVEYFADEVGDWRVVVHSVFGARTNQAWGMALAAALRRRHGLVVEWVHDDDGVMLRFPELDDAPPGDLLGTVSSSELVELVTSELASSAMFAARFREIAQRALLLPRSSPGGRVPLWLQRLRAADLLTVAARDPGHPLVLETYREILEDVFDLDALTALLRGIERGTVEVAASTGAGPSPFAAGMLWRFVFSYLYQGDLPKAEAQAAQLLVSRDILSELLGTEKLRDLLEPDAVDEVTAQVTRTAPGWRARDAAAVADVLRRFGDCTDDELAARCEPECDPDAAIAQLGARVARVDDRWVDAGDAASLRAVLDGGGDPAPWVRRRLLGGGVTTSAALAERYRRDPAEVDALLGVLADEGVAVRGMFLPDGVGDEWVAADTLARMHRRSLALLRHRTKPVDGDVYARWLLRRHGLDTVPSQRPSGVDGLDAVLSTLEGAPLPADGCEESVLAPRVDGYQPSWLDALLASGRWTWRALPGRRVAFVRPRTAPLLDRGDGGATDRATTRTTDGAADAPMSDPVADAVLALIGAGGGWRCDEIAARTGHSTAAVDAALDTLARAGRVTNDSFAPMRRRPRAGGRSTTTTQRRRSAARRRSRRPVPEGAGDGRWSVTVAGADADPAADAGAVIEVLLRRHGVVARETYASESWRLPWQTVRRVLLDAESTGELRRGYFVQGPSGMQFASTSTVDGLRAEADTDTDTDTAGDCVVVAAADPANPWGTVLERRGVRRAAGALVVCEHGVPVVELQGVRMTPLSDRPVDAYRHAFAAIGAALVARRSDRRAVEFWGAAALNDVPDVARVATSTGWLRTPKGVVPDRASAATAAAGRSA